MEEETELSESFTRKFFFFFKKRKNLILKLFLFFIDDKLVAKQLWIHIQTKPQVTVGSVGQYCLGTGIFMCLDKFGGGAKIAAALTWTLSF